jgi:hypothetical protein
VEERKNMCLVCRGLDKGKYTPRQAEDMLMEVEDKISEEHYEEVNDKISEAYDLWEYENQAADTVREIFRSDYYESDKDYNIDDYDDDYEMQELPYFEFNDDEYNEEDD